MDIHNINEDIVVSTVQSIFGEIEKQGNPDGFCFCEQCRMDTICYVLNRLEPHYIVSNRGFTRIDQDSLKRQQIEADIDALVYKGLRLVNHNQRHTAVHTGGAPADAAIFTPVFELPAIAGQVFDGISFTPISEGRVTLICGGTAAVMRNSNWQNPFALVSNTPGGFSFWPAPVAADTVDIQKIFEYSLKIESPAYEPLIHFFNLPSVSKIQTPYSHSMDRTCKLPDLYLFPPGEAEQNNNQDY